MSDDLVWMVAHLQPGTWVPDLPSAGFATEVAHPVQYGPGVKAFLSYGSTYQLLPK